MRGQQTRELRRRIRAVEVKQLQSLTSADREILAENQAAQRAQGSSADDAADASDGG